MHLNLGHDCGFHSTGRGNRNFCCRAQFQSKSPFVPWIKGTHTSCLLGTRQFFKMEVSLLHIAPDAMSCGTEQSKRMVRAKGKWISFVAHHLAWFPHLYPSTNLQAQFLTLERKISGWSLKCGNWLCCASQSWRIYIVYSLNYNENRKHYPKPLTTKTCSHGTAFPHLPLSKINHSRPVNHRP